MQVPGFAADVVFVILNIFQSISGLCFCVFSRGPDEVPGPSVHRPHLGPWHHEAGVHPRRSALFTPRVLYLWKILERLRKWIVACVVFPEEDLVTFQAALLEQVNTLQPLLDSNYIRGTAHFFQGFIIYTQWQTQDNSNTNAIDGNLLFEK